MSPELGMRVMVCEGQEGSGSLVFCIGKTKIVYHPLSFSTNRKDNDYIPSEVSDRSVRGENVLFNVVGVISEAEGIDPLSALQAIMNTGREGYDVDGKGEQIFTREVVNNSWREERRLFLSKDENSFSQMMKKAREKGAEDCDEGDCD